MCLEQKGKVSTQMMITRRGKITGGDFLRFGFWCPKTILKYPPRGATGNLYAQFRNALKIIENLEQNHQLYCSLGL